MAARPQGSKPERQQLIREIIARTPVANQRELADELASRGLAVTSATVSRDAAELGLIRVKRGQRHRYVLPEDVGRAPAADDARLQRLLRDIPVTVGRSGLILLLVGTPGTANTIAQALDDSSLTEMEGTLAGDDTTLVLFADEARLERWLGRFRELQGLPTPSSPRVGGSRS
jgi:transcriptional regulator of arginine metabolism